MAERLSRECKEKGKLHGRATLPAKQTCEEIEKVAPNLCEKNTRWRALPLLSATLEVLSELTLSLDLCALYRKDQRLTSDCKLK